jgi:hypothetical protein
MAEERAGHRLHHAPGVGALDPLVDLPDLRCDHVVVVAGRNVLQAAPHGLAIEARSVLNVVDLPLGEFRATPAAVAHLGRFARARDADAQDVIIEPARAVRQERLDILRPEEMPAQFGIILRVPIQRDGHDGHLPLERPHRVAGLVIRGPVAGTRVGQSGQGAPEVVEFTDERRGSSVAEQLIRKQPQPPPDSTQPDVTPGNQTQQP